MKIVVYGSLNIDKTFRVDHITGPGETQSSYSIDISAGGKGANQAVALSRAGANVHMAGKIGENGVWMKNLLKTFSVNTDFIRETAGFSGEALIQLDTLGQNCIVLFPGSNQENSIDEMKVVFDCCQEGDWVVCQNEISNVPALIALAHSKGLKVCLNPSPYNQFMDQVAMDCVDVVMVNEIEAAQMAKVGVYDCEAMLDVLAQRWPNIEFVVTAGSNGAYFGCGTKRFHVPAFIVPVTDTTGAGDVFTGYYLAARIIRNHTVPESLAYACKAASIAISRYGAIPSIPFANEVFT